MSRYDRLVRHPQTQYTFKRVYRAQVTKSRNKAKKSKMASVVSVPPANDSLIEWINSDPDLIRLNPNADPSVDANRLPHVIANARDTRTLTDSLLSVLKLGKGSGDNFRSALNLASHEYTTV